MRDLSAELARRQRAHLYRSRRIIEGPQDRELQHGGRTLLSFCSNDYLGFANHPEVRRALQEGAERYGVGSGAAHLVSGHSRAHHDLEEALAAFTGRGRALLFSTGYMANLGVIQALVGSGDLVLEDRLNHASLLDGGLLSRARFQRFTHGDVQAAARSLGDSTASEKLLATDGVFSMDGDVAPLPELAKACQNNDAWLMVDDAHGLGVIGPGGRGTLAHFGLGETEVPVLVGTLGKAFGTFGAFIAGSEALIETLVQSARTYIYTTALPPALACATLKSLELIERESWRREQLAAMVTRFRAGAMQLSLQLTSSFTPIQPVILGDAANATRVSERLLEHNILVPAIRPPTVPEDSARLRITFCATHTEQDVDRLLDSLAQCL